MPGLTLDDMLKAVSITGDIKILHKPGAVRLDDYPRLAYAPTQWGVGVRTEDKGVPVADIAAALSVNPSVVAVARQFDTTPDHVRDAIKYAESVGFAHIEE